MKKNSLRSCLKILLAGLVIPTLFSSSCGRAPVEYLDETPSTVTVTGAFADWTPGTSSFAKGRFILLDSSTYDVFFSDELSEAKSNFSIENVPITGKYYGILVDSRFEPRAYLEKKNLDGKIQRIFKFSNTLGKLGSIVVRDQTMLPSQQAELEFQSNIGVTKANQVIKFDKEFISNFNSNPDIDQDGIPNPIDLDVDGDVDSTGAKIKYNIFDAFTYKGENLPDSSIASSFNYAYGIPKLGFFKCNFMRSPDRPSTTDEAQAPFKIKTFYSTFSCNLKLPRGFAESVELMTVQSFLDSARDNQDNIFDKKMRDDGDGSWSAQFKVKEGNPESFKEQLIFALVKLKNGSQRNFVTTLEPKNILKPDDLSPVCAEPLDSLKGVSITLNVEGTKADLSEFNVSLRLRNENGVVVENDKNGNKLPPLLFKYVSPNRFEFASFENTFTLAAGKYYPLAKITAPSALPGILGSAFEFYLNSPKTIEFTAQPDQSLVMNMVCQ